MNMALERFRPLLDQYQISTHSIIRDQIVKKEELLPIIAQFDGVICSDDELNREVLQAGSKLKAISKWGVGIDSIDQVAAKELGIPIYNSAGAFSEACAVITIGMIIDLSRSLRAMDQQTRQGVWGKIPGLQLKGKKIGIIGVGNIGKEVIKRAHAFDMNIFAYDVVDIDSQFIKKYDVKMVDEKSLYSECDYISLHAPLNESTRHKISYDQFSLMRPSAFLINTARGPLIHEEALIWALENKKIQGVGLDVFEQEPLKENHPLFKFPQCILSAHNSYNTIEAVDYVHENTLKNMVRALTGNTL